MTHRWMKFWPQDWQADGALRACSLAARGLWMEMLCLAHAAEPYGHVTINGKPATTKQLANIIGAAERDVTRLLSELEDAGVFSVADDGMIYSRRMVRDKAASDAGRMHGREGGNPALKQAAPRKVNGGGNPGGLTPPLKHQEAEARIQEERYPPTPRKRGEAPAAHGAILPDWLSPEAWAEWCHYRRGKTWTQRAAELSIANLGELREAGNDPERVIRQSIANGWRGLFPLKSSGAAGPRDGTLTWILDINQHEGNA